MQQAEVDFVMGELAQAIDLYKKALSLEPRLYDVALYVCTGYFKTILSR